MDDFLCGCEYCITVNKSQPLDIAGHMMRCHSERDSMLKLWRIMNEMKTLEIEEPEAMIKVPGRDTDNDKTIISDKTYVWTETEQFGSVYTATEHLQFDINQWLYIEGIEWVWSIANEPRYLYSYEYGWLYNMLYKNYRIYYWYDRRLWFLPEGAND